MATIWQKLDHKLNTKIKILRNSATLILVSTWSDMLTGKTMTEQVEKSIVCTAPKGVSANMIDHALVMAGDMKVTLDYLSLKSVHEELPETVKWNETTAFLQPGIDMFRFGGISYSIRSIMPQDWMNDMPGEYLLILKGISG